MANFFSLVKAFWDGPDDGNWMAGPVRLISRTVVILMGLGLVYLCYIVSSTTIYVVTYRPTPTTTPTPSVTPTIDPHAPTPTSRPTQTPTPVPTLSMGTLDAESFDDAYEQVQDLAECSVEVLAIVKDLEVPNSGTYEWACYGFP